jgi:NTE family protein
MFSRPDVLVLGGGGIVGESWLMGVLAGLEDAAGFDMRQCEYFVGTSAGSIVAAHLVAGRTPWRPSEPGADLEVRDTSLDRTHNTVLRAAAHAAGQWARAAYSPVASFSLRASSAGSALARAALLRRIPTPERTLDDLRARVTRWGTRFDGRLRVTAVDRRTGRRVVFGSPGAPAATVAEAVEASCTVPWLFAPVKIGGREYVDGGVWSATNLDVAPVGRDTYVLCLNPTAGITGSHRLIQFARNLSRSAVSLEAMALQRRGAIVSTFGPDADSAAAMGNDFMNPAARTQALAAGYRQGLGMGELQRRPAWPRARSETRPRPMPSS